MPKGVQGLELAENLTRKYGLTGKVPLRLDEVIVPVHATLARNSPYQEGIPGSGRPNSPAGGAGVQSFAGVRSIEGRTLGVDQVTIENVTGGLVNYTCRILNPTNIATLTINTEENLNAHLPAVRDDGTFNRLASTRIAATAAGTAGDIVVSATLDGGEQFVINFPRTVFLEDGDAALGVWAEQSNTAARAAFLVGEYPWRGER